MPDSTVYISKCSTYEPADIYEAVGFILGASGFDDDIRGADTVLLKPNMMSAREPARGVTTHPEVVRSVAIYCMDRGCTVRIGDSPAGALKGVKRVWGNTGIGALAEELGIELINFETYGTASREVNREDLEEFHVSRALDEADLVISLPKLKTHTLTMMSCAVKNMFGVIPGLAKAGMHRLAMHPDDFGVLLVDLFECYAPDFSLVDATVGMAGDGPASGELFDFGFMAGGRNAAQLDLILSAALGLEPDDVKTVSETIERNMIDGETELALRNIDEDDIFGRDVQSPATRWIRRVPRPVLNAIGQSLILRPEIARDKCTACERCFESCPMDAITMPEGKACIDKKKCIQCLCCHELCDYEAVPLKGSPLVELYFSVRDARRKRRARRHETAKVG
ncbi:MAG: DUF362 domain-containing protein [bacterium]|nr:DUF362 domain-containing protein [bacterium]